MISELPDGTQAVLIVLSAGAAFSAFMCIAPPAARRERWRKQARQAALPSLSTLPLVLWSSSSVDVGMSLAHWLLIFGLVFSIYGGAGVVVSRRMSTTYPEEWRRMKGDREIEPAVKKRIEDEMRQVMLIATIPAFVSGLTVWAVANNY